VAVLLGVLAATAGVRGTRAQTVPLPPQVLASYTFEGNTNDVSGVSPAMVVSNAPIIDSTLFLNGVYGPANPTGYVAQARVPRLSYDSFTFRLEFKPASLSDPIVNLISGGPSFQWLGLSVEFGVMSLRLQLIDLNWLFQFPEASITTNGWNQLILTSDGPTGRIRVYLNGLALRDVQLLPGFKFNVTATGNPDADKVFSFSNDGDGTTFNGWIDNFKVYDRALSESEVQQLLLPRLTLTGAGQQVVASWAGDLTGYSLQKRLDLFGSWQPVSAVPQPTNSLQVIVLDAVNPMEFYRLVRP
jgi:hypothetical protein